MDHSVLFSNCNRLNFFESKCTKKGTSNKKLRKDVRRSMVRAIKICGTDAKVLTVAYYHGATWCIISESVGTPRHMSPIRRKDVRIIKKKNTDNAKLSNVPTITYHWDGYCVLGHQILQYVRVIHFYGCYRVDVRHRTPACTHIRCTQYARRANKTTNDYGRIISLLLFLLL